ncbi:MAG: deoxyribonuclease IV, partial [Planctomycetes bacterium]|nr:deoxyribonuclease IV [Planctomycetota bacterium]
MSIAGGVHRAVERGVALRCTAIQLFTRNNVQWRAAQLSDEDCARFRAAWAASRIGPIIAHANYLIDLASRDEATAAKSLDGLILDLRRSAALGLRWVVLHPGCHQGAGEAEGLRQVAAMARKALDATREFPAGILFETTAGQGTSLGYRFEHIARLLDAVGVPERLGVCLDTCHVFAAGYDLRTPDAYAATMGEFDRIVGLCQIRAIHVNDAKRELGSHVDRHEHVGRGKLGRGAFRLLMCDERFADVPKLLETPKLDARGKDWDAANLRVLRRLAVLRFRRKHARGSAPLPSKAASAMPHSTILPQLGVGD